MLWYKSWNLTLFKAFLLVLVITCSKRIQNFGLDSENTPSPKQLQLQRMVREYANSYLQKNLLGLQSLPTMEQYEELKEQRKMEIQSKIEFEKQAAMERAKLNEQKQENERERASTNKKTSSSAVDSKGFVQDQGWKPSEIVHNHEEDDPMVQQINNIKAYIRQAKEADRWEEARMFEQNLKELQQEYWRQKQGDKIEAEEVLKVAETQNVSSHASPSHKLRQALPDRLLDIVKPQRKSQNPFEGSSTTKKSTNPFY